MDNDSELAFVLSHEIAHTIEAYGGTMKYIAMTANSKKYEYKADLNGIDYMVKAGYDPIGAITISNKIFAEPVLDWGFFATHPKGSKRLLAMYKYIYVKYNYYLVPKKQLLRSPWAVAFFLIKNDKISCKHILKMI